ncbi:MAG TPA: YIP1 family protein [Candidatus Acidoferrales bacterium]|nr:YIP1 family protein [Candidatus Acidoferrales bacterium]
MTEFKDRLVRASKLDTSLYEEVENDPKALGEATLVVVLSSVAAGIGGPAPQLGLGSLLAGTIVSLLAWYVWAYLTYVIGTKLLPEAATQADWGQLLRTTGFSSAPGLIRVLGVIPGLAGITFLTASIWMLIAMVVAVRQALDYTSTPRAVGVCVIGWLIQALILALFFTLTETPIVTIPA